MKDGSEPTSPGGDGAQKLLKGCHQGQNVTVLAMLERLEFKTFSFTPTTVADKNLGLKFPTRLRPFV